MRVGGLDCRCASSDRADEQGRIGILLVACIGVVALFVIVSAAITSVAVQDRRLIACADRLAVAGAGAIDEESYYMSDASTLELSDRGVENNVRIALIGMSNTSCSVGQGVELMGASIDGNEVLVTVTAQSRLPYVPLVFSSVVAPILTRSSTAVVR